MTNGDAIRNMTDTDDYFRAMSVFGCEVGDVVRRSKCRHNCCDGENCVIWMEKLFRDYDRMKNVGNTIESERVAELMKADAEGGLVVLKHAVGTSVFMLTRYPAYFDPIEETKITGVSWFPDGWQYVTSCCLCFRDKDIGKTVFLTREQAEGEMEEEHHETEI